MPAGHQLDFAPLITTLSLAAQTIFHPPYCPLIQPISHQFRDKETMADCVKGLAKVKLQDIHCPPLVHRVSSQKAVRLARHNLPLSNPCSLLPTPFSSFTRLETVSKTICSITFPGAAVRLTSLQFLSSSFLPFLRMAVMLPFSSPEEPPPSAVTFWKLCRLPSQ